MKNWLTSLTAVIALNLISFINFIARSLLDWRYVYPDFIPPGSNQTIFGAVLYLFIFGVWFWGLIATAQSSRGALIMMMIFNLVFLLGVGLGTTLYFCPSPCPVIWPVSEVINWSNIIFGLLTPFISGLHLWAVHKRKVNTTSV
jgi:hypothetical protein